MPHLCSESKIMEEYIGLEIEEFGIYLQYPEWWQHRVEEDGTHLFWDEYVGSFRMTGTRHKAAGFDVADFLVKILANDKTAGRRTIGKREFICSMQDNPKTDGVTRLHLYVCGHEKMVLTCSFAYDLALLDDEFSREGVEAALQEVEILLELLRFGEEED